MQAALTSTFAKQGIGMSLMGGDSTTGMGNPLDAMQKDDLSIMEEEDR